MLLRPECRLWQQVFLEFWQVLFFGFGLIDSVPTSSTFRAPPLSIELATAHIKRDGLARACRHFGGGGEKEF